MNIKLISCISLDYDLKLIPHFLSHYSKLNISNFHFILHKKENFNVVDFLYYFSKLPPFKVTFQQWVGEFNAVDKIEKYNSIIESTDESHILLADVDEFQNHKHIITEDYVWGHLVDREPQDKLVKEVDSSDLSKQFPIKSLRSNWVDNIKICVFPSSEKLVTSHHTTTSYRGEDTIPVDHYRWTDTRYEKASERYAVYSKLNKNKSKLFSNGAHLATADSLNIINMLKKKTFI